MPGVTILVDGVDWPEPYFLEGRVAVCQLGQIHQLPEIYSNDNISIKQSGSGAVSSSLIIVVDGIVWHRRGDRMVDCRKIRAIRWKIMCGIVVCYAVCA